MIGCNAIVSGVSDSASFIEPMVERRDTLTATGYAVISGVYYYKTNGDDGDIFFECPVPTIGSSFCYFNNYCNRWIHKPEEGKILLFPSWLKHGISKNETDETRISISFNLYFDRGVNK